MNVVECLQTAKLLPTSGDDLTTSFFVAGRYPLSRILPALRAAWESEARKSKSAPRRQAAQRRAERLHHWEQLGACLMIATADASNADDLTVPPRLLWWPWGQPPAPARFHSVLCSRLGRSLERWSPWFRAVGRALRARSDRDWLVAARGTAAFELTCQYARRRRIPLVTLSPASSWMQFGKAIWKPPDQMPADSAAIRRDGIVSPIEAGELDRLVAAWSDRVVLGEARPRGNVARALASELADGRMVRLLSVRVRRDDPAAANPVLEPDRQSTRRLRVVRHVSRLDGDYLFHWTRRCRGAWPGQSVDEYWSDLLAGGRRADRSARAALMRIVETQAIVAGTRTTPGVPVVCFTQVPLVEFDNLRTFRPHRGRWDFQLYGVGIRHPALIELGARKVRYTTDREGPYCQPPSDRTGRLDWTREREWRILGDVDLRTVSRRDRILFVATRSEAAQFAQRTSWPVYYFQG